MDPVAPVLLTPFGRGQGSLRADLRPLPSLSRELGSGLSCFSKPATPVGMDATGSNPPGHDAIS